MNLSNKFPITLIAINFALVIIFVTAWAIPMAVSARSTRNHISLQQRHYAAVSQLNAGYQYLLQELEILSQHRQLLTHNEAMHTLSDISHLASRNNLREISLAIGEATGFDTLALGRAMELNVRMENEGLYTDILNFLYEIENTPAIISHTAIVWEDGALARINLDLSLFFQ